MLIINKSENCSYTGDLPTSLVHVLGIVIGVVRSVQLTRSHLSWPAVMFRLSSTVEAIDQSIRSEPGCCFDSNRSVSLLVRHELFRILMLFFPRFFFFCRCCHESGATLQPMYSCRSIQSTWLLPRCVACASHKGFVDRYVGTALIITLTSYVPSYFKKRKKHDKKITNPSYRNHIISISLTKMDWPNRWL